MIYLWNYSRNIDKLMKSPLFYFTKYFVVKFFPDKENVVTILSAGNFAPINIELKNSNGDTVTIKDYLKQKYLVVYFYPQDGSYDCTIEACEIRDIYDQIKDLNADVVGISKDSVKSHLSFISRNSLNFRLLSDEDQKAIEAFGVKVKKYFFGAPVMSVQRTTFLIDLDGKILKVWNYIPKGQGHAEEICEYLKEIQNIK